MVTRLALNVPHFGCYANIVSTMNEGKCRLTAGTLLRCIGMFAVQLLVFGSASGAWMRTILYIMLRYNIHGKSSLSTAWTAKYFKWSYFFCPTAYLCFLSFLFIFVVSTSSKDCTQLSTPRLAAVLRQEWFRLVCQQPRPRVGYLGVPWQCQRCSSPHLTRPYKMVIL